MNPGEIVVAQDEGAGLEINPGLAVVTIVVSNTGDRPVQVGSHYHFFETNDALSFDREKAYGMRLNIASGTAIRFEAGDQKEVELVEMRGERRVFGLAGRVNGLLSSQI